MMYAATLLACFSLIGWLYLTFLNGWFWRILLPESMPELISWPSIDIIVPARNEANILPQSLPSLLVQNYPGPWRVILVDDHSTDSTGAVAQKIAADKNLSQRLFVVNAPDLPEGWSGKVAAMQAGTAHSSADYILFTDADIEHPINSLRRLAARAVGKKLDMVSLMVKLHCASAAEKLLIPAFVFFFAMLYPFHRANNPRSSIAAAAGGVMLIRRKALENIGGLKRIKMALIDDCSLARAIKDHGGDEGTKGQTELTLTHQVKSLRLYPDVKDVWQMVARTAFTQLHYSPWLLMGTVIGLTLLFMVPPLLPIFSGLAATGLALAAWILMSLIYAPMVRFYGLSPVFALTLPVAALIYIGATIDSARLYWQGKGGQWKGRAQA